MNLSTSSASPLVTLGTEWVIDALGCHPAQLRARATLEQLFDRIVTDLRLKPVAPPMWHVFPGSAGITGLLLLSESHLACHTFPERGFGAFNLYCCRDISPWPWETNL